MRQSELREFIQCRRKWYLQYVKGYEPVRTGPDGAGQRSLGTVVHAGLAAYYEDQDPHAAMLALVPEGEELAWADTVNMANIMLNGYVDWAEQTGADAALEVLAVEMPWEVDGMEGRMDLVVHDHMLNGPVVLDHKCVQTLSQLPPQNDFQLLTYALGYWRTTGERPVAVGHNMLRKVKRTGAAKPPFYDRVYNHISEAHLLKHEAHLRGIASTLATVRAVARDEQDPLLYPNPNRDCTWRCDFVDICAMVDEGGDYEHILETAYEVRSHDNREEPDHE